MNELIDVDKNSQQEQSVLVEKLEREKAELEEEFTEIIGFIINDMKKQEELINELALNKEPSSEELKIIKNKNNDLKNELFNYKQENQLLKKRLTALENSKLGKLTLRYWKFKRKILNSMKGK